MENITTFKYFYCNSMKGLNKMIETENLNIRNVSSSQKTALMFNLANPQKQGELIK